MSITVSGRKMPVTDALRAYAEEKIGNSMKVMDIDPLNAEVVLSKEKNPANPCPDTCEVTLRTKGHIIRVEEHEDDMYAAIDVAAAKDICELLRTVNREEKRAILLVTHDPVVAAAATRVHFLRDGRIVATHETDHDPAVVSRLYLETYR